MLKILFVNHSSNISGAEKVLLRLIGYFDKSLIEVSAFCPESKGLAEDLKAENIDVRLAPMPLLVRTANPVKLFEYCFGFYRFSKKLIQYLRIAKIDIIHCNSFISTLYSIPAAKLTRTPIIWHMHDILRNSFFNKIFICLAGLGASRIICVSNAVKKNLISFGVKKEKCQIVYNSIKSPCGQQKWGNDDFYKEFAINHQTKVVTMIGQIAEWKGQKIFIEAVAKLIERYDIKSLIVGDVISPLENHYKNTLRKITNHLNLNNHVIFTGFRTDIQKIIDASDIIVHASVKPDPLPTVIIEAMNLGRPVVATHVGGVPELIEHNKTGLIVPPHNCDMLAEAISKLLDNPEKAKSMGSNAKNVINEKFDPEINLSKVLNIYCDLLPENKKLQLKEHVELGNNDS